MRVATLIGDFLVAAGRPDLMRLHELDPFSIHVLRVERTLCEKIMGLVLAGYEANPGEESRRRIRHFYDVVMIMRVDSYRQFVASDAFVDLMVEVRECEAPVHYLVGTPKGRLTRLEKSFLELPWRKVRESVEVKLLAEDGELYILAQSRARIDKERGMRRRRLKRLWRRLHELRGQSLKRDELLLKLGAAKKEAGRAWNLVEVRLPKAGEDVTPDTFTFALRRDRLRKVRRREGRYLLRSNLAGEDPETLWRYYMQLSEIEQAFKELKHDLAVRPVFHQRGERIEAHIFVAFVAYCLHVTLKNPGAAVRAGTDAAGHPGEALHLADGGRPSADHRRAAPDAAAPHPADARPPVASASTQAAIAGTARSSNLGLAGSPPDSREGAL